VTTVVRSWDRALFAAAADIPIALAASALAFGLDLEGSAGQCALAAGLVFALIAGSTLYSLRVWRGGKGVEPLPPGAVIKSFEELRREALIRFPLWAGAVALITLVLGTLGPGMAIGAALGGLVSAWIWEKRTAQNGVKTFQPERGWLGLRPAGKDETWIYTRLRATA
jgi:hypothetical protein